MDVKRIIMKTLKKKQKIKTSDIVKTTGFSRAYVNRFFQELRDEGRIVLIGRANRAHYVLASEGPILKARNNILDIALNLQNRGLHEDRVLAKIKKKTGVFNNLRKNVTDILDYAFSEMLNNAIEHSTANTTKVMMKKYEHNVTFSVVDRGVGIFNNIVKKKKLKNVMEALQDLLKGKQTTMPQAHSGEGIFFTSKAADMLIIKGSNKKLIFDNLLGDIFIKDIKPIIGTKINFSIDKDSKRKLSDIFKRYADSSFEFSKTEVTVRLFKLETQYISRSQARRIVAGLDKFKTISLDFKDVKTVGQGFADEIFRVWKSTHPGIGINVLDANDNVQFMINRAKA